MRFALLILTVVCVGTSFSQKEQYIFMGLNELEPMIIAPDSINICTTLKPYHPNTRKFFSSDTTQDNYAFFSGQNKSLSLYPLFDIQSGYDLSNNLVLANSVGLGSTFSPGKKWVINANYLFGYWDGGIPNETLMLTQNVVPGLGYARQLKNGFQSHTAFGSVSYTPNDHFSFEIGHNKHFVGSGYRSLLLSDNANVYPYFKIDTRLWNIRYTNIYSWMLDIRDASTPSQYVNKFSTTHVLDWNVTKSWSLALYESIVWQAKDTLLNRGYDINYLNPVIFYRPVEYAQGSSDNAIIGLNSDIKITENVTFYQQIVLDEFLLDRFKADIQHFFNPSDTSIESGWWANKYAIQFGLKWKNIASVQNLNILTEFNLVRPFMYSHGSVYQNFGHFNQPLAHPRGANFYEWLTIIEYRKGKIGFRDQFIWSAYGTDNNGISYGGDIYESYTSRQGTFGHTIAQGNRHNLFFNDLSFYYVVSDAMETKFSIGYNFRSLEDEYFKERSNFVYLRIRTALWNRYYDY